MLYSPFLNRTTGALLALAWVMFAWENLKAYGATGSLGFLLFFVSESLQAAFFALRKDPKDVTRSPSGWIIALLGTFAVLSFRPGGEILFSGGATMIEIGFVLQILALISLNRSFAIVAANRGVKTEFGYSVVRHPIYATYLVSTTGYLLYNWSTFNLLAYLCFVSLTLLRIDEEERLLSRDTEYVAYKKVVRWRLVPFLY